MATPIPVFPAAVVTDAQLKVANNTIQTALTVILPPGGMLLWVNSVTGFLANCLVSVDSEIIAIASITTNPAPGLVVAPGGRGFDATAVSSHNAGAKVSMLIDAWHHNALASEVKAIEAFIGPNGSNLNAGFGELNSCDYDFPPQTPGNALIIGANVITLAPVPRGVNGADSNHYLYISNGTGAAEGVLITGGTAVAGAPTGTVIVTCANAHSGPWTISSATGGQQEALQTLAPSGFGIVRLGCASTIHGPVTFPSGRYTIDGGNPSAWLLTRGNDYPTGALYVCNSGGPVPTLMNFQINNINGTAAILLTSGGNCVVNSVAVNNGAVGIEDDGGGGMQLIGNWDVSNATTAAVWIHSTSGAIPTNIQIIGGTMFPTATGDGFLITAGDGIQIIGTNIGAGRVQMNLNSATGQYITNLYVTSVFFDNAHQNAVVASDSGASQGWRFVGCHVHGGFNGINESGFDFGTSSASSLEDLSVIGTRISGWGQSGIAQGAGVVNAVYSGNIITDNNVTNDATHNTGILLNPLCSKTLISGNQIKLAGAGPSHQAYAVKTLADTSDLTITGNDLSNNGTGAYSFDGAPSASMIANNNVGGIPAAVASAAAITVPDSDIFKITGATTVTTINGGWEGRQITIIKTDAGTLVIGGGGNVPVARNLIAATSPTTILTFDGVSWF